MTNRLHIFLHNVKEIVVGDFKHIRHNVVAWVIIVGLTVIPSLYAWYNIQACWDPYGNTGSLKIALANDDAGYDGTLSPIAVNMGDTLVSSIRKNDSFNWVVTDSETAIDGVKSGKYYAAIVIPKGFSNDLMSLFSSNIKSAELVYYSNEKENAIASKVTDTGASAVEEKIDTVISKTVIQLVMSLVQNLTSDDEGNEYMLTAVNGVVKSLSGLQQQIQMMQASVDALSSSVDSMVTLLDSTGGSDEAVAQFAEEIKKTLPSIDSDDLVKKISNVAEDPLKSELTKLIENLASVKTSTEKVINDASSAGNDVSNAANMSKEDLITLRDNLNSTSASLGKADQSLGDLITKLQTALADEDLDTIRTILGENSDALSSFLSAPVNMDTKTIYPVANYGSAMAPFYTSLAIWVGGTILACMIFTTLSEDRRKKLKHLTYTQEYVGRYVLFLTIGLTQAFITCGGDLWFLGIQCEHPVKFILIGLVSSIVFVNLAYTMVASFGEVGKGICVVLLVIQVAGSGGIFPIEMEPRIFRALYPLLPFAHSMPAMREAIAGCYGSTYWKEMAVLLIYLALSLLIGLVLRRPIIKIGRQLEDKLEDTKVI